MDVDVALVKEAHEQMKRATTDGHPGFHPGFRPSWAALGIMGTWGCGAAVIWDSARFLSSIFIGDSVVGVAVTGAVAGIYHEGVLSLSGGNFV